MKPLSESDLSVYKMHNHPLPTAYHLSKKTNKQTDKTTSFFLYMGTKHYLLKISKYYEKMDLKD